MRIKDVDRHLTGIPLKVLVQHAAQNMRTLVPGKPDIADFSCIPRRDGSFNGAIGSEDPLGIVVVVDLMELPYIDDLCTQSAQALL